jgi:uncharacterized protein YaaR (DUF327 family)
MKAKKSTKGKDIDPKKKRRAAMKYDGRAGYYPTGVNKKLGRSIKEYFDAEDAPKEASRLNLDTRLTDAVWEVSDELGASEFRTDKKINDYVEKSRQYISDRISKRLGATRQMGKLSEGETKFIPKLDKVVDKLSTLSDDEIKTLKDEVIKLSKPYKEIDPKDSAAGKLTSAVSIASGQDWSKIKPIREKAGLSKDDLISLIQAPEDSAWYERAAYSAARGAVGLKDFKNGGKVFKSHNMYKNGKALMAKTMADHLRLKKQGYSHKK